MNPKQKSMLVGALLGAGLGALGGFLFARSATVGMEEEEPTEISLQGIAPGEMVKLAISIMGVLRSVAEMGERG
jgi:hypothetical protein